MFSKILNSILIILIASGLFACAPATPAATPTAPPPPTATPVPPTDTPEPTITPSPTPVPTATPDAKATKAAIAKATEDAMTAQIKKELADLGLPTEGKLVWVEPEPDRVALTEYGESRYMNVAEDQEFKNFILKVEVSWFSKSGLAGCGIIFRAATPNIGNSDHYEFLTMRLAGAPAWDFEYYKDGVFTSNLTGKVQYSKTINITNGSSNTYYLVANGDTLSVYTGGKRLGQTTFSKLDSGHLAWFGFQESGETSCSFKNAWVWELP